MSTKTYVRGNLLEGNLLREYLVGDIKDVANNGSKIDKISAEKSNLHTLNDNQCSFSKKIKIYIGISQH